MMSLLTLVPRVFSVFKMAARKDPSKKHITCTYFVLFFKNRFVQAHICLIGRAYTSTLLFFTLEESQ